MLHIEDGVLCYSWEEDTGSPKIEVGSTTINERGTLQHDAWKSYRGTLGQGQNINKLGKSFYLADYVNCLKTLALYAHLWLYATSPKGTIDPLSGGGPQGKGTFKYPRAIFNERIRK